MINDKNASKHKGQYERMSKTELRQVIDGHHAVKDYGAEFQKVCEVFNSRFRKGCISLNGEYINK